MCNQQLISNLEVAMRKTSVPFPSGHGVFLFDTRSKVSSKYLGSHTTEQRSLALLLFMGFSPYYSSHLYGTGYKKTHNKLIPHWLSFAAEWATLNGFFQLKTNDLVLILEAAYNIINPSNFLSTEDKKIIRDVYHYSRHSINNYIKGTYQQIITPYLSPKSLLKSRFMSESNNMTSYNLFFKSDLYKFIHNKSNFFELYFWVRLEALLKIKIIFDITANTIESVLRYQKGSFVDQVKQFVTEYSKTYYQLSYSNTFFSFIDETATNPKESPTSVTDALNGIPFMTIDNGCWSADFDFFLDILNTHCPTTYTKMLEYDKSAISVAYAFTDNLMFKKPSPSKKPQSDNSLQKDWDDEVSYLSTVFKSKSNALVGGLFNRETVAARVHNGPISNGYYLYYAIQQATRGNVALDARANFATHILPK